MRTVRVGAESIRLSPTDLRGEGGEAEIFVVDVPQLGRRAIKFWKTPDHPDYEPDTEIAKRGREAARMRLLEYPAKLALFPKNLGPHVIGPEVPVLGARTAEVVGYAMRFLDNTKPLRAFAQPRTRTSPHDGNAVLEIFRHLRGTVGALHGARVVIGDFNSMNVLVDDQHRANIIDTDSMQFGSMQTGIFPCRTFTPKFVDPLVCAPPGSLKGGDVLVQVKPHSITTDWYAFAVMLFECLLGVAPYGGVYEPRLKRERITNDARPLKRVSVFDPEVVYPLRAIPFGHLSDELLGFYDGLLKHDRRGVITAAMLEAVRWTRCTSCGAEHARVKCPVCAEARPTAATLEIVRGKVRLTRSHLSAGEILHAAVATNGAIQLLEHEGGNFVREGRVVLAGGVLPGMRYRICGEKTLIAQGDRLFVMAPGREPQRIGVDTFRGGASVFDANDRHYFWLAGGQLWRDDVLRPRLMGQVLQGQTLFWAGPSFGFGFYRAGGLQVGFVFDAEKGGINDSVKLPRLSGEILDARCYFTSRRAWFFVSTHDAGRTVNRAIVVAADGTVVASAEAEDGDGSWLGSIGGKLAMTLNKGSTSVNALFAATSRGLVRVEESAAPTGGGNTLVESATFPDTKGLVDDRQTLLNGTFKNQRGLHLVDDQTVQLIQIS